MLGHQLEEVAKPVEVVALEVEVMELLRGEKEEEKQPMAVMGAGFEVVGK